MPDYLDVGIIVVVVLALALDKILGALRSRGVDLPRLARQIEELHAWHNVNDADGVKVWYVRESLRDTIGKLSDTLERQNRLLAVLCEQMKALHDDVKARPHV